MIARPLFHVLANNRTPDALIAFGGTAPLPYQDFRARVSGLTRTLRGCRSAALTCRDSGAFVIGLFALLHAGAEVILPPNGPMAGLSGAVDLILDDATVWAAQPDDAVLPSIAAEASVTFFTSGSTGTPKRVSRSLAALEREAVMLEQLWGGTVRGRPVLSMVGHQHLFGLTFKVLWPLAAGRPFDARNHELWESLIEALPERAVVISSPAHLNTLGGLAPLPSEKSPAALFSAGSPLTLAASQDAEAILACCPTEIFGSTETGAIATRQQTIADQEWTLLPGHRLLDHPEDRLRLHSPYDDTIVVTGDRVERVGDGFRFLGRADRIVKIGGKRVDLTEVEVALTALPWVESAAALVLPELRLGAVTVLTEQGRALLAELKPFRFGRHLRRELLACLDMVAIPKSWRFTHDLPRHPLGKSRTADLLALFTQGSV